tara:strand:- start:50 stop:1228 length:1179 start_codon:yes stop_codon:yes gene_type:complete
MKLPNIKKVEEAWVSVNDFDDRPASKYKPIDRSKEKTDHGIRRTSRYEREDSEFTEKQIKMAFGILNDPRYKGGNLTAAIEAIAPGLSEHPAVQRWARESVEDEVEESSPGRDGPDYKQGDLIVAQNGRTYVLDEYDDGIWWAVGDDGDEYEFEPGTELHHEPMSESEDDNVVSALDTMRTHLHDYEHDPSDRWEKYNQYKNERQQITQRAKDLTEIQETTQKVKVGPNLLLVDSRTLDHIATHNEIGIGSVFAKGVDVTKVWNQLKFGGEGGAYTVPVPNAGYNLVLPIDKAKALPDAQETSVEKDERGTKIEVPAIKTSAPLAKFATDQVTFIIRPSNPDFLEPDLKQDPEIMSAIENGTAFSLLTAFPGDPNIPPASQWNGQFAVILPS